MDDPFIQLLKKILIFVITLILVATFIFILFRVVPGDPLNLMFHHQPGQDVLEYWRHVLGLDKSLPEQFVNWMVGAFTLNFGVSSGFAPREQIGELIQPYLGKTIILFSVITAISLLLGSIIGRFITNRKDPAVDKFFSTLAAFFFSAPVFIAALFIILIFASFVPGWPFQGTTSDSYIWSQLDLIGQISDVLTHALIPVTAVVIPSTAMMVLVFRKGALDQIRNPPFNAVIPGKKTNRARMKRVPFFGTLSKSMPLILLMIGWIMVGVIAVEYVLTYKGIGYLLWESILSLDISLLMAVLFLLLVIIVSTGFLIDLVVWIISLLMRPVPSPALSESVGIAKSIDSGSSIGYSAPESYSSIFETCSRILSQLLKRPMGAIFAILLIVMFAIAIVGPFIASENPTSVADPGYYYGPQPPSGDHLLGTDYRSKDIFSQMLWGGWPIMVVGITVATVSVMIGMLFGSIAGSLIRKMDEPIMIIADLLTAVPIFIVLVAITVVTGRTEWVIVPTIMFLSAAPIARAVRNALSSDQALANRSGGNNPLKGVSQSITHDVIPKAIPGMLSSLKFVVVIAILTYVFFEFFGLGDPRIVSWGWILQQAHNGSGILYGYWWWIIPPITAIVATCASFFFVIDALEDITRKMFVISGQNPSPVNPNIPGAPPREFAQP